LHFYYLFRIGSYYWFIVRLINPSVLLRSNQTEETLHLHSRVLFFHKNIPVAKFVNINTQQKRCKYWVGVNQMWILKNSKDLLEYVQSKPLSSNKNIETFEFLPFT